MIEANSQVVETGGLDSDLMDTPDVREKSIVEKRKRRQFTKEFKPEAVRLDLEQKQTPAQAARDLGVMETCLSR